MLAFSCYYCLCVAAVFRQAGRQWGFKYLCLFSFELKEMWQFSIMHCCQNGLMFYVPRLTQHQFCPGHCSLD